MGVRCQRCGLVNFATEIVCRRCSGVLSAANPVSTVEPGLWRDAHLLVMGGTVNLPGRCMKCNSQNALTHTVIELDYFPKYNLILLLTGFVTYRKLQVPVVLCQSHASHYGATTKASVLVIILGILGFIYGFSLYAGPLMVIGGGIAAAGFILAVIGNKPFSVERREPPCIWLKGVDERYLALLPGWSKRP